MVRWLQLEWERHRQRRVHRRRRQGVVEHPGCLDDPGDTKYKISGGDRRREAPPRGAPSRRPSTGTKTPNTCTAASESKSIPTFTFNSANYPAATFHSYSFPTDYTAFNNYIAANKTNLSGTFYITGGSASTR